MNIRVPEVLQDCSRLRFNVNIGPVAKTNLPNFAGGILPGTFWEEDTWEIIK